MKALVHALQEHRAGREHFVCSQSVSVAALVIEPQRSFADISITAPDAMDQLKKAFKGLFGKKKAKKEGAAPTATTEQPSASTTKPTETTPAAPAPATAPEPVKSEQTPASTGTAPAPAPAPAAAPVAAPAAAPAKEEAKKDEVLAEVKPATQSKSTPLHLLQACKRHSGVC